jgi:hypothetical protein
MNHTASESMDERLKGIAYILVPNKEVFFALLTHWPILETQNLTEERALSREI